jgi:hypothetical protein
VTLADIYTWYAQRDWAVAAVVIVALICGTTFLLYWWSNRR